LGAAVTVTGFNFGGTAGKVTACGIDQAITFTLSGDTYTGAVTVTRADGTVASAPNLTVRSHLDKIESNNVPAGTANVVDGASLGAATGTAKVGDADAKPQLWSRTSVLLALPTTLKPGTYPVVLNSASGTASNALSITIADGAAGPTPRSTPTTNADGFKAPSSFIDNNHQFHKPPKTDSPVQLSLAAASHQLKAGGSSDLTMVLTLNGKPVNGADQAAAALHARQRLQVHTRNRDH
jgi:hypothetical protein